MRCREIRSRSSLSGAARQTASLGGGHTDPHSALGTAALAGVLAAKAAIEKFGIVGTLLFFGEPAEKVYGSKPVHAAVYLFRVQYSAAAGNTVWQRVAWGAPSSVSAAARQTA
jgi:metal-dependent amidase/aminoacylase/carboxypeptidase family protein